MVSRGVTIGCAGVGKQEVGWVQVGWWDLTRLDLCNHPSHLLPTNNHSASPCSAHTQPGTQVIAQTSACGVFLLFASLLGLRVVVHTMCLTDA